MLYFYAFFSFKCAEKAFPPEVNLNINDYQYGFNNAYGRQVADMLARGAKIDIVGSQMHLFDPAESVRLSRGEFSKETYAKTHPEAIAELFRTLSEAGRPIHLSEITITAPDNSERGQMVQAIILRNCYRAWCMPAQQPQRCPAASWQELKALAGNDRVPDCPPAADRSPPEPAQPPSAP